MEKLDMRAMASSDPKQSRDDAEAQGLALTKANGHARRRNNRENQFMFRSTLPERKLLENLADQLGRLSLNETLVRGLQALDEKLNGEKNG